MCLTNTKKAAASAVAFFVYRMLILLKERVYRDI